MAPPPSVPLVVTAVPVPGVTAAERLVVAQARVDALDLILEEKLETLGQAGIVRPKDALLFVKDLQFKEGSKSVPQLAINAPSWAASKRAKSWFREPLGVTGG